MLTAKMFIITCPLLFLAGFVDSIGGGGGLVSLPAYIFAGVPIHGAIATNKLSSVCGTSVSCIRYIKSGMVSLKFAIPGVVGAFLGAALGAELSMAVDSSIMEKLLLIILPIVTILVFNKNLFEKNEGTEEAKPTRAMFFIILGLSFLLGTYDGFYGPGTGTFCIILLNLIAKMNVTRANGLTKVINLSTNASALVVFLLSGQVIIALGLAGAACNMLGNFIGSGLVLNKGSKIVRPIILVVLGLLFVKIIYNMVTGS